MPSFSLNPTTYQRITAHLPADLTAELDEMARIAEEDGARLMVPQQCEMCLTDDALTTYGWASNPARPWENRHVCGSCRWMLEGNKVARTVTDESLELSDASRVELMSALLHDRHWFERVDEHGVHWWAPDQERGNPDYGQTLTEAFENEFHESWPVVAER